MWDASIALRGKPHPATRANKGNFRRFGPIFRRCPSFPALKGRAKFMPTLRVESKLDLDFQWGCGLSGNTD